jgi:hypothetical protein
MFDILGNSTLKQSNTKTFFVVVKFLKCAENVPKPSNYSAPLPEGCGKVVF